VRLGFLGSRLATAVAVLAVVGGCVSGGRTLSPTARPTPSPAASSSAAAGTSRGSGCPTSAPPAMAAGETATVTMETSKGTIVIKVEGKLGPQAAGNFFALAKCGFYDGVVFHRLAPGFVIQGGDPLGNGSGGPGYEFKDDPVTVPYKRGTVAMANAGPDTNGSQFFICLADLTSLPPSYSVFGHVTSGMDVVDTIATMPNSGPPANSALQPVAMSKVTASTP